jgi:hypothetical protein
MILAYQFHEKGFLLGVNSKEYQSRLGKKGPHNIELLMKKCVFTLNEEQLTQFFLATLHNRNFWDKAFDQFRSAVKHLERVGINVQSYLSTVWENIKDFIANLLA